VLNCGGQDGGLEEEYKNWAWHDARLTELGISQASALAAPMAAHSIELALVSPLSRAIQTALHGLPHAAAFRVEELVRERNGTHPCDKRRSKSELAKDFPSVDFSPLLVEEDDTWTPEREPMPALIGRAGAFLRTLAGRPEKSIAVVTHNDFLQALLLEAPELQVSEPGLRRKFLNAESLGLWFTWSEAAAAAISPGRAAADFSPRP
jgi:broad specificity phosphatase PhoE